MALKFLILLLNFSYSGFLFQILHLWTKTRRRGGFSDSSKFSGEGGGGNCPWLARRHRGIFVKMFK